MTDHEEDDECGAPPWFNMWLEMVRERHERMRESLKGPFTKINGIIFYGSKSIKDEWKLGGGKKDDLD
ncbi:MAG: hypothetical protein WC343_13645 [Bacilli bacterium]|jgi:hypothetical protein